ncbi:MAG: radical SAM protein [Myxococcota bacterium]
MQPALFAIAPRELATLLGGPGRAAAVWGAVRRGLDPFAPGVLADGSHRRLLEACRRTVLDTERSSASTCGTRKLLVRLHDDCLVETVLIPHRSRSTVCVSTQVGCARGCVFCATATMGMIRSLAAEEIVGQVALALTDVRRWQLPPLRNVVLMGMGEPLDNLDAVRDAVTRCASNDALGIGAGHVTLSTVGTTPARIAGLSDLPARIAWSVHAADDTVRRRLVPTTRYPMTTLRDAFVDLARRRGDLLFVEVALAAGVNDTLADAQALATLLAPFDGAVRVNLLPLNRAREDLTPSADDLVRAFRDHLRARGYFCMVRRARGAESQSACGQLAAAEPARMTSVSKSTCPEASIV